MLLQRLIADDADGFNYDVMGSAEYEFGVTRQARISLAETYVDNNLRSKVTNFIEVYPRYAEPPVPVVILSHKDVIASIGDIYRVRITKCSFRTVDEKIIGWMRVQGPTPLLMVRYSDPDRGSRIEKFLQRFVDAIEEDRAKGKTP